MFWYIVGGAIIFAIGLFFFTKPDVIWRYTEGRKPYQPKNPTKSYLKITKTNGVIYMVLGAVVIALYLFA